jgi:integrase
MASNSKSITDLWEGKRTDGTSFRKARYGRGKRYRAWYRDAAGRQIAKHFERKRDAQDWLDSITAAVQTRTYVDPNLGKVTVALWAERWISTQAAHLKPTTLSRTKDILRTHVLPRWGSVPLIDVTHMDVQSWVATLSLDRQPATVRKVFGVLSRLMSVALKDCRIARNPCAGVDLPRALPARRRYLNHAEVAALATAAGAAPSGGRAGEGERAAFAQYELVVYVLAYCGLRWGELAALKVSSVDLLRRRLEVAESVVEVDGRLVWGVPKTHERRSVPMPEFVAAMLSNHIVGMGPHDILFTGIRGGGVLRNRIFRRSTFDRAAYAIGYAGLVPKEIRHTAASLAISAGANVKVVQRMLGHASAAMTLDTYADLFDEDLDGVADRLHAAAEAARTRVADPVRTRAGLGPAVADLPNAAGQ